MEHRGWRARRKLEEAKFFLDRLLANFGKERNFDFFLSAFISAARSVTWVVRTEYSEVAGWKEWYVALEPSEEERRLLGGTNTLRIRTQKLDSPKSTSKVAVGGIDFSGVDQAVVDTVLRRSAAGTLRAKVNDEHGRYRLEVDLEGQRLAVPATIVFVERALEEFPGENVASVCTRYYEAVSSVVSQCGAKFDT